jgi:hypothetical protein|tara:strand:- start:199 stop:384 length:186 start_codon:yes stop_codon:yes gene_type:complete
MAEFNLDEINLEDLLFILGGTIFQGSTADDIEIDLLVRLQELLKLKIEERTNGMPLGTILH